MRFPTESPVAVCVNLSEKSRKCVECLWGYDLERPDLSNHAKNKQAAVLVLLYEREGKLRVLLTTRSKTLRAHPGQTALPGGKVDESDTDMIMTAYREAHEEVALPLDSPHIHTICTLEPFLSAYKLLVTPVVALLTDLGLLDNLTASATEVARIFDHPLEAILDPEQVPLEDLVLDVEDWPYDDILHNASDVQIASLNNSLYRMHRFRSAASPIKGLTSDILIRTAEIAYQRQPVYERLAPGQSLSYETICRLLEDSKNSDTWRQSSSGKVASVSAV